MPGAARTVAASDTALGQFRTTRCSLAARARLASNPFRPAYHYFNPEGHLNDPNGLCIWQGK